jgi:hypothetical protein
MAKPKKDLVDIDTIADKIEYEGFGYCLEHYFSGENFADPKLKKMWIQARKLAEEIQIYIADNSTPLCEGYEDFDEDRPY